MITTLLALLFLFVPCVSAQDWNISDDWDTGGYPSASPTPNPAIVNVFNNVYAAIIVFSVVGVVCVVSGVFMFVKGDGDAEQISMIAGALILIGVGCFIGVVVSFAMEAAIF